MKNLLFAAVAFIGLTGVGMTGFALAGQAPVAVVEDMKGKVSGAELMDYVVPGQVIKLGAGASVTIGYMKSCWRETISGLGTVIIGTEQSSVHLAQFKAGKVPCDSSQAARINKEAGESAATLVRGLNQDDDAPKDLPPLMLHGRSPIVATSERGKLVVERTDVKGERYVVDLGKALPARGKAYDLARSHIALKPGGAYSMTLNSKSAAFVVDRTATPGAGPVIGRLVTLQ
jgi:hypothetical protein